MTDGIHRHARGLTKAEFATTARSSRNPDWVATTLNSSGD